MIYIHLPFLPPTVNNAYETIPKRRIGKKMVGGGRRLTKEGKAFKRELAQHILEHHAMETGQIGAIAGIGIWVSVGFPDLLNKGYPEKAKTRYKKKDALNRRKVLDDGLSEVLAFDDSQIIFDNTTKYLSQVEETRIWMWDEEVEAIGARLTQAFASLAGLSPAV